jgi:Spy/CpxP family protein refolding chaperone
MNKRSSLLALALALLVTVAGARVFAQTDTSSSLDPETRAKVQQRLDNISTELNLTDAQKQQIKPILQSEVQQLKSVRDNTSLSADQRQSKAKDIHQSSKSQIEGVLTPDQQKKLESMREQAQEDWK